MRAGSAPSSRSRSATSGVVRLSWMAYVSFVRIATGVPLGTTIPYQAVAR
jgi:hypothetical protein